ncbi:MAG: helix-turn-helix domain-containing protein [Lachnospiraceae bacterium]|jgi:excisionase family DNA binding protein|nr:helix-turn-helix domain-containing protein [Lachnospiraceae bacterium]
MEEKVVYTIIEVCKILHLCDRTVKNLIKDEKLKALRLGNRLRVTKESLDEYLEECEIKQHPKWTNKDGK